MAKYTQGKDGKFTGSIGDGKNNVPAPAPQLPPRMGLGGMLKQLTDPYALDEALTALGIAHDPVDEDKHPRIDKIVGATVSQIHWSEDTVTFETDKGLISFQVFGDCCSQSYFHDIVGVQKLLENGPVTGIEPVWLQPGDTGHPDPAPLDDPEAQAVHDALQPVTDGDEYGDVIQVYGYRLTTEHPQWGPMSTVLAFRNSSNGYYGGWMEAVPGVITDAQKPLTGDYHGD